jgi:F0F1-type ATP synthase membrane subunit b/b'
MDLQGEHVIVSVVLAIALVKMFKGPIGAAIAERIGRGAARADDPGLSADLEQLRGRLAEVEERLDFAERLLAQAREADQLPGGPHP